MVCSSLRCDVKDSRPGMTCQRASYGQINCKNSASCNIKSILIVEYLARSNTRDLARGRVLQMWCAFQRVCSAWPCIAFSTRHKDCLARFLSHSASRVIFRLFCRAPAQVACNNPQPFARRSLLPNPASHCPPSCNMQANDSLRWGGGREAS